ncbi:DEAD/DEAH box helicase [Gordonia amarae]|uniref:RNA helicase n=2 Tax=Gordonia amarae TaxID=36821 RepID=G7GSY3_9ACTN|nr:DEAD/DEAH box helicase [Gordonia amarae]MCS3880166.1 superfamily II DNA/RNA helicase [Gordonia amarae]QHN31916.1 DEAD/DEAH box helicase [Gordonia amarae]QHN40663.1 DEAD/DEAH box helicase [Gordonia amarae]GAB06708.1 putative ATP-dependent RNA helicase [Gordonia amarae NBRC 15530]
MSNPDNTGAAAPGTGSAPTTSAAPATDEVRTTIVDDSHVPPTFAELGVDPQIVEALIEDGKAHTFAIQELTLPLAMAGDDLIGQARTGMGKTFGFGVPLLHRLANADAAGIRSLDTTPRALIIVPTRELCIQVTGDIELAAKKVTVPAGDGIRPLKVTSIYGGRPYESQIAELQSGVDVVIGTPGRLLDLAQQGHLILGKVQVLVLDEADEMLDLGFLPDIERIMASLPADRQTMLFSATMPGPIVTLARTFLNRPTHIRAEQANDSAVHDRTAQFIYRAHALDKAELVARILQAEGRGATMVFTRTKRTAQKVADDLAERGFKVGAVHGDLGQVAREKALKKFREGKIDVLVATDVAARGIDIDDVTHVINYQCPEDDKTYVHRIGRTGRAGRTGIAITLVDWDELHRWELINSALGIGVPEPVETYSTSEHLRTDLNVPESATGRIAPPPRTESAEPRQRRERPVSTRTRTRRRTRSGQPVEGGAEAPATQDGDTTEAAAAQDGDKAAADGTDEAPKAPRKRRRRRGGSGRNSSREGADGSAAAGEPVAVPAAE